MKRTTIIYAVLLFCAALTAACSKEAAGVDAGDTGALEMRVSTTRAEADGDYNPLQHLLVRIYRGSNELLRQYTNETLPTRLELSAGEYRVEVEAGEVTPASFTKRFYKGEKSFTVAAGQTTVAEVECKRQNVVAEVKFNATVPAAFGENFHAWVVAADTFDAEKAEAGSVPALKYQADGTGYFTMPEGVTTLTAHFEGTHPDRGVITKTSKFEGVQTGGKYSVSFKFSKDLPGFIECFVVKVDTSTDDYDDTFPFSPEPTIESDGFDMSQSQDFIPGKTEPKRYKITTMAAVRDVEISINNNTYDALNGTTEGIEVVKENDLSLTVTLSDAFFAGRPGGSQPVTIRVADAANSEATVVSEYRLQGILPTEKADYNLWTNSVTLTALILDPDITTATFGLRIRKDGGQWTDVEGASAGNGIYTATFTADWEESTNVAGLTTHTPKANTGVFAGNTYESRVVLNGTASVSAFTPTTTQTIPDGNMENGSLSCFTINNQETAFWGSGNNDYMSSIIGDALTKLCTQQEKGGSKCALLASQYATMLAAGNLFSGTFVKPSTQGTVGFGKDYAWEARPTAMRLKYHASLGTVNRTKYQADGKDPIAKGEMDKARVFVAIVDWDAPHGVSSGLSAPSGMWDPERVSSLDEGAIIGYGSLWIEQSTTGDDMVTIDLPIYYYDKVTKPSKAYKIVISCSANAYGDYMNGCDGNRLYVDDFEWVY